MITRTSLTVMFLLATASLAACSGTSGPPATANYTGNQGPQPGDAGILDTDPALTLGVGKNANRDNGAGGGIGVNAYLWRGALDTLGFMPLASADPFGGVIITDWYTPAGATDERFKATAYILGRELRSNGIRIAIFRQVLQNGQWVDASVSPVTVADIEDKVLARARQLREQSNPS